MSSRRSRNAGKWSSTVFSRNKRSSRNCCACTAASRSLLFRSAIREVDPHLLVSDVQPAEVLISDAQAGTRFSLLLIGAFALIAGLLAGVGLYGVLSTAVRQRTSEIGVRMTLGAEPSRYFQLVVGQGFRLSAIGISAGLIAALALTRLMSAMLVGVRATDPRLLVLWRCCSCSLGPLPRGCLLAAQRP